MTDEIPFGEMVTNELERLVGELLVLTEKLNSTTTPQGKNLYGKKVKKLQTKVMRMSKLASATTK